MLRRRYVSAGTAFVSFSTPDEACHAMACINAPNSTRRYCDAKLRAARAPEPGDLLWENLAVGSVRERAWRQLVSTSIMLGIALFGTSIIAFISYVNSEKLARVRATPRRRRYLSPPSPPRRRR